ncbi:MAG: TonB-dependent receptor [Acidobacteria bacterium]|nr:TonB-dependent receptor [Acidobacteriota bacterium]
MSISRIIVVLMLATLLGGTMWGQSTGATLVGTVTDSTGAIVVGAKVTVTNEGTGISVSVTSNESGGYAVANLPAATYTVHVELKGFQTAELTSVRLMIASTGRANVRLMPGTVEQSINVTAAPPAITSDTSSVANVIDNQAIANLPLNGRMIDRFIQIAPGNTSDSASNPKIAGSMHWGSDFFTVDGIAYNDMGNGGGAYSYRTQLSNFPSVDTIQEFRIESNNAKAEFEGVAAVSMVTKSGTNDFHGSLLEFNRNRVAAAKEYFATAQPKPQFNRNEFGATLGGRIIKNKTFFFGSYEGLRQRTAATPFLAMGTSAMRSGNFAGLNTVRDPLAGGTPFANNQIPSGRLDSRVQTILSGYVPLPNQAGTAAAGTGSNYVTSVGNIFGVNRYMTKVDHNFDEKNVVTINASYNAGTPYFVANGTPATYGNFSDGGYKDYYLSLTYTHTFTPSVLNEFRTGYFDHRSVRIGQNTNFNPSTLFPTLYSPLPVGGLPTFNVTGFQAISDTGGSERGYGMTKELTDNLSFVRGNHAFKTGADMGFSRAGGNPSAGGGQFGTFNFNGRYSGVPYADFLMGYQTDDLRATVGIPAMAHNTRWGAYFQDDWRVSHKLTLNIGMRYFLQTILNERDNSMAGVDFNTGQMVVTTVNGQLPKLALARTLAAYGYVTSESKGWGRDLMEGDHNNFAPRFGFAYRPFDDNKTVVRGGYGIFYGLTPYFLGPYRLINGNAPFVLHETFTSSADPNNPTLTLANPFPGSGTISANPNATTVNRHMRTSYSQQWNFTLERDLGHSIGLRTSYVGNKTTRVIQYNFEHNYPVVQTPGNLQPNRPYQPWASVAAMDTNGNAFTNQLQVEVIRHYSKGLLIQSNFTWNKSIDNAAITTGYQNPYNMALDRGNADQVRDKVFYGAVTYELPLGPGKSWVNSGGVSGKLVGGWTIATITQLRSGQPFNVNFSPSQAGWYANRANVVSSQFYPAEKTIKQWFNVAAFAIPAPFTFGNSARGLLFGPGQKIFDVSLMKNTAITDRFNLQFRAEAFNLPNTPSFGLPASNISAPATVGTITGTTVAARTVQFGLKLLF